MRRLTLQPVTEREANSRLETDPAVLVTLKFICATCCGSDLRRWPVEREPLGPAVGSDKILPIVADYRGLYEERGLKWILCAFI